MPPLMEAVRIAAPAAMRLRIARPDDGPLTQRFVFPVPGTYQMTAWTHQQWAALEEFERPRDAIAVPGYGWVRYEWISPEADACL